MIPIWIIKLKCGYIYNLRVKGFYFNNDFNIIELLCAYNKRISFYFNQIENRYDLTLYTGGSI